MWPVATQVRCGCIVSTESVEILTICQTDRFTFLSRDCCGIGFPSHPLDCFLLNIWLFFYRVLTLFTMPSNTTIVMQVFLCVVGLSNMHAILYKDTNNSALGLPKQHNMHGNLQHNSLVWWSVRHSVLVLPTSRLRYDSTLRSIDFFPPQLSYVLLLRYITGF